jgi:phosphoglucomutase
VISFLILEYNRGRTSGLADGVVVTPSHNPPRDGGFKYNAPNGGPADVDATDWVQNRANQIMKAQTGVKRMPYQKARLAENTHEQDFIAPFVDALPQVVDLTAIKNAGLRLGADPLGGSGVHFWSVIADKHGLDLEVVNTKVDPTFGFMTLDADGLIRMDCSSPYAMANLISLAGRFDVAFGNDPDFDRHGIVCPTGLMNPNHYLSTVIWYLIQNRPGWPKDVKIGKTLVGSSMMDKVALNVGRPIYEVPVGFKWFVEGLQSGRLAMGLEESAGGAFLRFDGRPWTTDKDGFTLALLAAEILAKTGRTPAEIYKETLTANFGEPFYKRLDGPITEERKAFLKSFTPAALKTDRIAGQKIVAAATTAQGNNAPIGGVKVNLEDGSWFAIRPSGTEPKMKIYIESFGGEPLWQKIAEEAAPAVFGE